MFPWAVDASTMEGEENKVRCSVGLIHSLCLKRGGRCWGRKAGALAVLLSGGSRALGVGKEGVTAVLREVQVSVRAGSYRETGS